MTTAPPALADRRDEFLVLLERHGAKLSRVSGGRGVIRCLFHADQTASLSIDVERALFHCFGCGVGGGLLDLRRLLGDETVSRGTPLRRRPQRSPVSPMQGAWCELLRHEERAAAKRAEWQPWPSRYRVLRQYHRALATDAQVRAYAHRRM